MLQRGLGSRFVHSPRHPVLTLTCVTVTTPAAMVGCRWWRAEVGAIRSCNDGAQMCGWVVAGAQLVSARLVPLAADPSTVAEISRRRTRKPLRTPHFGVHTIRSHPAVKTTPWLQSGYAGRELAPPPLPLPPPRPLPRRQQRRQQRRAGRRQLRCLGRCRVPATGCCRRRPAGPEGRCRALIHPACALRPQGDGLKEARPFNERKTAKARCGTQLPPASYDEVSCIDVPQGGGVMTLFSWCPPVTLPASTCMPRVMVRVGSGRLWQRQARAAGKLVCALSPQWEALAGPASCSTCQGLKHRS